MKPQQRILIIIGVALGFALGAAAGWIFFGAHGDAGASSVSTDETGRKVLYWYDPMVAGPKFDKPGKSPFMDMDLVPMYADEAQDSNGPPIVTVRPEIVNSLGVRTAPATRGKPARETTAHGYLMRSGNGVVVFADIFERDATWVRAGFVATVRVPEHSGKQWSGVVETIERDVDVGSRALRARVRLKGADSALTANTLVEVVIRAPAAASGKTLYVPREAVIRTGTRTSVILALGEGRFQPIDVVAGAESGDYVEIANGLKENDSVVVSGQFLIDSDASARASFDRMETPTAGGQETKP
jgi:Cu(I)/Ag(I) efflux system membrane fusion protein